MDEQPKFNKVRCGLVMGSAATQLSPQKSSERQASAPFVRTKNAKMQIFAYIFSFIYIIYIYIYNYIYVLCICIYIYGNHSYPLNLQNTRATHPTDNLKSTKANVVIFLLQALKSCLFGLCKVNSAGRASKSVQPVQRKASLGKPPFLVLVRNCNQNYIFFFYIITQIAILKISIFDIFIASK